MIKHYIIQNQTSNDIFLSWTSLSNSEIKKIGFKLISRSSYDSGWSTIIPRISSDYPIDVTYRQDIDSNWIGILVREKQK